MPLSAVVQACVILKPVSDYPLSHFGTGYPSSNFSTLSIWGFSTADKTFVLGQLLKVVHGGKNNVNSNRDFPRTGDHS